MNDVDLWQIERREGFWESLHSCIEAADQHENELGIGDVRNSIIKIVEKIGNELKFSSIKQIGKYKGSISSCKELTDRNSSKFLIIITIKFTSNPNKEKYKSIIGLRSIEINIKRL